MENPQNPDIQSSARERILILVPQETSYFKKMKQMDYKDSIQRGMGLKDDEVYAWNVAEENGLPPNKDEFRKIVLSGSAEHNVYEEGTKWMPEIMELVRQIASDTRRILFGICLGQQVAVEALGGRVERRTEGPLKGISTIFLTNEGAKSPIYNNVSDVYLAGSYHNDIAVELPENTSVLASGVIHPYQALGLGENIWTTQHHPESDETRVDRLLGWARECGSLSEDQLKFALEVKSQGISHAGGQMLRNFANL